MNSPSFYRAVWRWHFYAGLAVLPVLLWLAVTGGLYLYHDEIDRLVYADYQGGGAGSPLPASTLIAVVGEATGGHVTQLTARAPGASWTASVTAPDGERLTAFVDPANGYVHGAILAGGIMKTVRDLHSLAITGPIGNALVEIVAGWAIVLVLSGFYLWWPRGTPALALRGRPRERLFWRDLHASTGAVAGLVILFLAVTGMPWSGVWGRGLQIVVAANDLGRPAGPPPSAAAKASLPWALREATVPGVVGPGDVGPDVVAAVARAQLGPAWTLTLPASADAPYLLTTPVKKAEDARAIFIDRATGAVLQDMRFADFGGGARAVEWGIAVHQGEEYGEVNRLAMLAGCIAIALLVVSAPVLWWKRRHDGRLSAPPAPAEPGRMRMVAALMLGIGALFPLTGATMLAALGIDFTLRRLAPRP